MHDLDPWPANDEDLVELQHRLALEADRVEAADPWTLPPGPVSIGACIVAFAPGEAGPGHPGDRAWAAAVVWHHPAPTGERRPTPPGDGARRAGDPAEPAVVAQPVPAAYSPGLLARREGPILAAAVAALAVRPDVLLVDATGRDHPRRAGLAVHLGAVTGIPTVGVTHRGLVATGPDPRPERGARAPVHLDGRRVGHWVRTRTGVRPVLAHAAWRTTPDTAAEVVLAASTEAARTPLPLREARRVAREARARAEGDRPPAPGGRLPTPGDRWPGPAGRLPAPGDRWPGPAGRLPAPGDRWPAAGVEDPDPDATDVGDPPGRG